MPLTLCHHLSELSKPRSQVPVEAKETEAQRGTDSCPRSPSPRQTAKPGLTQGPPNPCLLPSCKWSRKTSSSLHCSLLLPNPRFQFQAKLNQPNQPKRKKKKKHLLVKPLCSVPSRDSGFFFGKSAGGGGPAREKFSPFYSLWPSQGNISEAGCFGGPSPCCSPLPFPRAPGRAEGAPVLVNAS